MKASKDEVYISSISGQLVLMFECPHEEKVFAYIKSDLFKIQFMCVNFVLSPCTTVKSLAFLSWSSPLKVPLGLNEPSFFTFFFTGPRLGTQLI